MSEIFPCFPSINVKQLICLLYFPDPVGQSIRTSRRLRHLYTVFLSRISSRGWAPIQRKFRAFPKKILRIVMKYRLLETFKILLLRWMTYNAPWRKFSEINSVCMHLFATITATPKALWCLYHIRALPCRRRRRRRSFRAHQIHSCPVNCVCPLKHNRCFLCKLFFNFIPFNSRIYSRTYHTCTLIGRFKINTAARARACVCNGIYVFF